ncbi:MULTISPECIES: ATP synthase F1 subunit gamma [Clostridium]|uniref:ATP synthase gamma chain n=1 Tax=Clostridium saccharoperbutylacetonicum N1-4(HMT) TaxID=931276 RepID=M1MS51_9CLOT|nr:MULTISPECIES: ATP synthase F1 subunit gamma [Clostridium]AGF54417.1 ATP synthase gamma chain [Clostridium saccharoperbutylacetonicum N1-4(HMT)]AQR93332.1 ATP synthase gamma chain [Clostridium saccharoperbutylacetonicum]NRT59064.1 F-type H+-transporting ATPase subunit gamma [Clostridium saccharoperbutylacetonicum]NSB28252.1 F-type H+-transporting ATPase subunit gamma [Clostridium saccharoperbutylacetonicum]NSB34749.1 F-type H+-transporting ATPase subunit gamma [Clostridium saccharoperbutylac
MGAAGLLDIKKRIKSVESTRKITNAMGLVATSKLRKTKKEFAVNSKFTDITEPIVRNLATAASEDGSNVYFEGNDSKNKLYVVITSDSGLCGGFNSSVVSQLAQVIGKNRDTAKVILVGSKGLGYLKKIKVEPIEEYVDIGDVPTVSEAKVIFDKALEMYLNGEVSEVNIVYSEFVSSVKQETKSVKMLPIEKSEGNGVGSFIIEPSVELVLEDTLNIYLKGKIRGILLSSKCSEQSTRMTAMDGATKNADDLLDKLKLKFNRIRQGAITQEISEIVGGAAAQN